MANSRNKTAFKTFVLNNDIKMPVIGLGTFRIKAGDVILDTVEHALRCGYRMFDTAAVYGNEHHLRGAFQMLLPKYGLDREDIFVVTKLSPSDHGGGGTTETAFYRCLENLGLDYIDLFLIHFPGSARLKSEDKKNAEMRNRTWKELTELYSRGVVGAIGVSNYTVRHLEELMANNYGVVPAVNQVEWHPYYHQPELLDYCKKHNILLQAYSSFGGTSSLNNSLLKDPTVMSVAKKLGVTVPQVLLVWALQQGVGVIPKSTSYEHLLQNISLDFTIPEEDMKTLSNLNVNKIKYAWDPSVVA